MGYAGYRRALFRQRKRYGFEKGERKKKAVTVSADAVSVHPAPYDENWDFLTEEDRGWFLGTPEQAADFFESSKNVFTKEQQENIWEQRNYCWNQTRSK